MTCALITLELHIHIYFQTALPTTYSCTILSHPFLWLEVASTASQLPGSYWESLVRYPFPNSHAKVQLVCWGRHLKCYHHFIIKGAVSREAAKGGPFGGKRGSVHAVVQSLHSLQHCSMIEEGWAFGRDSRQDVTGQSGASCGSWAAGWWQLPRGAILLGLYSCFLWQKGFSWKWISCYYHFFLYSAAQIIFSSFFLGFPHHTHPWTAYSSGICHLLTDLIRVNY